MRKKLLFVNPSSSDSETLSSGKSTRFPPLGLISLAATVPHGWDIELIDENVGQLRYDDADLVGITAMTYTAPRAYAIAAEFRKKGIPVVIGGVHPSFLPEEAANFADSVVIGEGEEIFPHLLRDFDRNALKKIYQGSRPDMNLLPPPRRDLLSPHYRMDSVQTSRGCPYACTFCSVTALNGRTYRTRDVRSVAEEIGGLKKKLMFFVDDNILGVGKQSRKRTLELFQRITEHRKYWIAQSTIDIADDPELLKAAFQSGCRVLYIGFESVSPLTLEGMNKKANLKRGVRYYKDAIAALHDRGIAVWGSFVFGNDSDHASVFQDTLDFIRTSGIDLVTLPVLTPLPGTQLYDRLKNEDRLIYRDYPDAWSEYSFTNVVFQPGTMEPAELDGNIYAIASQIYPGFRPERQLLKTRLYSGSISTSLISYSMMRSFARIGKKIMRSKEKSLKPHLHASA